MRIDPEVQNYIDEHGYWAEMPGHPVEDWRDEVRDDNTRQGYHQWISGRLEVLRHEEES